MVGTRGQDPTGLRKPLQRIDMIKMAKYTHEALYQGVKFVSFAV